MRSALCGIYIIDKSVAVFRVGIIVLHRNFNRDAFLLTLTVNDLGIKGLFAFVQILYKFQDTALIMKALFPFLLASARTPKYLRAGPAPTQSWDPSNWDSF